MRLRLKYYSKDTGFCRVYYKSETNRLYCKQEDYNNVFNWYACTKDGEPDCKIREGVHIDIINSFKDNKGQEEQVVHSA